MTDTLESTQINHPAAIVSRQILLSTAQEAIQGYNTWSLASILSCRAPTCVHYILPSSLHRPPLNNEQYAAYFTPIMPAFEHFHLTVHDSIVDEVARKVLMHVSSSASTALGPYNNEYMLILHMTEDGRKVEKFYEFVDSAYSADYMRRLRDAMAESAQGTRE